MKGLLLLLALMVISCDHATPGQAKLVNGTYKGYFTRSSPTADWMSSNVTLEFTDDLFLGDSDLEKYPAICSGTYTVKGSEINFENQCPWTAEFDWSFILAGKFEIKTVGHELILTRKYDEHTYDQYILTR